MSDNPVQFAEEDVRFMDLATQEARKARDLGEVPVGAVIVDEQGTILARAGNKSITENDPSGHAEIIAMREAGKKIGNYRLLNTTLYVTIEPCVMCAGAMIHARISRLVYGAQDPKTGAVRSRYNIGGDGSLNHRFEVTSGVLAEECAELLSSFFQEKRG
jgi:tRNA(adenine34) deaminase